MQFFRGGALLHDHIYLYPGAAVLKKKTPILFFDTALKVLLPRGGWVCLSKGFCGFFEGFAKLIITKIFSVITSIRDGCFGSGFQTLSVQKHLKAKVVSAGAVLGGGPVPP